MIFRVALLISGAVFLAFGLLLAIFGDLGLGYPFALVGAGLILIDGWPFRRSATRFPVHEWIGMGLVTAGLAANGHLILAATLFPAAFLVLLLAALLSRRGFRRARSLEFEVVGPDEVMAGAEPAVEAFEADGFARAGGYSAFMPPGPTHVVATLLVTQSADRYAAVTDRVVEVSSRFGGERWLLTTNSGNAPLPDDILRQLLPRGGPAELAQAHETAIGLLSARGVLPDRLEAGGLVELAIETERRVIRFASGAGWRQSPQHGAAGEAKGSGHPGRPA